MRQLTAARAPRIGERVDVHLNLDAKRRGAPLWSVTVGGKVIAHMAHVCLADVAPRYWERGRLTAVANKRRKVCAWLRGTLIPAVPAGLEQTTISFNPYRGAEFTTRAGIAVKHCQYVEFTDSAVAHGSVTCRD